MTSQTTSPVSSSSSRVSHRLDIASLMVVSVLLAAGFILDLTVGKACAITGIQPEFIISSYCLALIILRPSLMQAATIGLLSAALIQLNTSIPGLEFICDIPAAIVVALLVSLLDKRVLKPFVPAILCFVATLISGSIFAVMAVVFFLKLELIALAGMAPLVLTTAVANAFVCEILVRPLNTVVSKTSQARSHA